MSDTFDLVIIGGGSAGLTGATFAARLGARVALVEKRRIGGDCTWTGCVPSKALVKAAKVVHEARRASVFGIDASGRTDMTRVRAHLRNAIDRAYAAETPEVLEAHGISVFIGAAAFVDARTIRVGDRTLTADRVVIATGAHPIIPDVAGLSDVPFFTHETIFDNDVLPSHLVVLGAGPVGLEIAQAYRRLGAGVSILAEEFLPREEPEARALIEERLAAEGVRCLAGSATAARRDADGVTLSTTAGILTGDMLLVATGRKPNVAGLALERAGVDHSDAGIVVDASLQTSTRGIYAAGDVVGGLQLTHLAGWQCFHAVRNALLPGSARGFSDVVPRVTFTDPEVAHVGTTELAARAANGDDVRVHVLDVARTDRAICDGETDGFLKVVARADGRILGATIVASRAGEMIAELALAIQKRLSLADLAATIHAYPTWSTAVQQLASQVAIDGFAEGTASKVAIRVGRWLR